jgi:hypothetical protein
MDYKYIEQLLDRYFQGETTLQEEQILKAFYAQGVDDMPQEISQYAPLFVLLNEEETLGSDFDERLLRMTEDNVAVKARTISLVDRLRPLFGAAAVVAILLTLGNAINQSFKQDDTWVDADEYARRGMVEVNTDEPAMAYDSSVDSLVLVNEGMRVAASVDSLSAGGIN